MLVSDSSSCIDTNRSQYMVDVFSTHVPFWSAGTPSSYSHQVDTDMNDPSRLLWYVVGGNAIFVLDVIRGSAGSSPTNIRVDARSICSDGSTPYFVWRDSQVVIIVEAFVWNTNRMSIGARILDEFCIQYGTRSECCETSLPVSLDNMFNACSAPEDIPGGSMEVSPLPVDYCFWKVDRTAGVDISQPPCLVPEFSPSVDVTPNAWGTVSTVVYAVERDYVCISTPSCSSQADAIVQASSPAQHWKIVMLSDSAISTTSPTVRKVDNVYTAVTDDLVMVIGLSDSDLSGNIGLVHHEFVRRHNSHPSSCGSSLVRGSTIRLVNMCLVDIMVADGYARRSARTNAVHIGSVEVASSRSLSKAPVAPLLSIKGRNFVTSMSTFHALFFMKMSLENVVASMSVIRWICMSIRFVVPKSMHAKLMLNGVIGLVRYGGFDDNACNWLGKSGRSICSFGSGSQSEGARPSLASSTVSSFFVYSTVATGNRLVASITSPDMIGWRDGQDMCVDIRSVIRLDYDDNRAFDDIPIDTSSLVGDDISAVLTISNRIQPSFDTMEWNSACVVWPAKRTMDDCSPAVRDDSTLSAISSEMVEDNISACVTSSWIHARFDDVEWTSVGVTSPSLHQDSLDLQASSWSSFSAVYNEAEDPTAVHASIAVISVIRTCSVGDCRFTQRLFYSDDSVNRLASGMTDVGLMLASSLAIGLQLFLHHSLPPLLVESSAETTVLVSPCLMMATSRQDVCSTGWYGSVSSPFGLAAASSVCRSLTSFQHNYMDSTLGYNASSSRHSADTFELKLVSSSECRSLVLDFVSDLVYHDNWILQHEYQSFSDGCCGLFGFAGISSIPIWLWVALCSSFLHFAIGCVIILSEFLAGTVEAMETATTSLISSREFLGANVLLVGLLESTGALQSYATAISFAEVLWLSSISTHMLNEPSSAGGMNCADFMKAGALSRDVVFLLHCLLRCYGQMYSRIGHADGGVLVMDLSLSRERGQALLFDLANKVPLLGNSWHGGGTVGSFILGVICLPLLFSQRRCFVLRVYCSWTDLETAKQNGTLLSTNSIETMEYLEFLDSIEWITSINDLVRSALPSCFSVLPICDTYLVYWALPIDKKSVSIVDFIDRSWPQCNSGWFVMMLSREDFIDRLLTRCNEWIDMVLPRCSKWFDRIAGVCELSLQKCNEWISTMIDIVDLSSWTPWFCKGSLLTWISIWCTRCCDRMVLVRITC